MHPPAPVLRKLADLAKNTYGDLASVYFELLEPALIEAGDRWERAEMNVTQEHYFTDMTLRVMNHFVERQPMRDRRRRGGGRRRRTSYRTAPPGPLTATKSRALASQPAMMHDSVPIPRCGYFAKSYMPLMPGQACCEAIQARIWSDVAFQPSDR
jgi:hypothetical protein